MINCGRYRTRVLYVFTISPFLKYHVILSYTLYSCVHFLNQRNNTMLCFSIWSHSYVEMWWRCDMLYSMQPSWRLAVKTGLSICWCLRTGPSATVYVVVQREKESSVSPLPPISLSLWLCSSFCKYITLFPCKQDFV